MIEYFDKLNESNQKEYLNLYSGTETLKGFNKIYEIFKKNRFKSDFDPTNPNLGIVCLKASRFNHSCRPNAFYEIDWPNKKYIIEIKASENIEAGQEITFDYKGT